MHLADLSELSLKDSEVESLEHDLQGIVNYISQISELDTKNVEPTYQVFEMENIWREDEILPQEADREALLNLAPAYLGASGVQDNQIKVPKVL